MRLAISATLPTPRQGLVPSRVCLVVAPLSSSRRARALDFAKFGQLYKNKGVWNGRRIIDESWIEKSLSNQVMISEPAAFSYGYLFWNKTFKVQGKEIEVSYCSGNGGNKIFICKDLPLVVVITAAAYNLPYAHKDAEIIFTDFILPAVFDQF